MGNPSETWYVVSGPGEQGPEFSSWGSAREYAVALQKQGVPARILGPGCGWSYEDEPPSEYVYGSPLDE